MSAPSITEPRPYLVTFVDRTCGTYSMQPSEAAALLGHAGVRSVWAIGPLARSHRHALRALEPGAIAA